LPTAEAFVRRWGVAAIIVGRFFGPLRASVPLVAGVFSHALPAVSDRKLQFRFSLDRRAAHFRGCVEFAFPQSIGAMGMVNNLRQKGPPP
jgi:hypothetical protein